MALTAEAGPDAPGQPSPAAPSRPPGHVGPLTWTVAVVAAAAVPVALAWGSYFFADDYLFLAQAREEPFGWRYLSHDLFSHFSPLTRLANKVLLAVGPSWTAAWIGMLVVFAVTAFGLQWLARVLFGPTVRGLVVAAVLLQSLGLVRILQWFTATANLLPGIAGLAIGLAAYVRFRTSRNPWWAVVVVVAYGVGMLGYDLAMILPGYLILAELFLLPRRVGRIRFDRWIAGLWVVLAVAGGVAALNYKVNYYQQTPRPSVRVAAEALRRSVGETIPGAALGLFRPAQHSGVLVAVALLVWAGLVVATIRARGAWRGWAFATLGVLPPVAAVIISRAGLYGSAVGIELYYVAIPLVFLVVGAAEAVDLRLGSPPAEPGRRRTRVLLGAAAYGVFLAALVWGGAGTRDVEGYAAASRRFTSHLLDGVERLQGDRSAAVLDTTAPANVVPTPFAPYNRADRILDVFRPEARLDVGGPQLHAIGPTGRVLPAKVDVRWSTDLAADGPPATATGVDDARMEGDRWCFTATSASLVRWDLPRAVAGTDLAVAFDVGVDRTTSYAWYVSDGTGGFDHASFDVHRLGRADRVGYETVRQPTVRSLALSGLAPGVRTCLGGVRLISVEPVG